MRTLPRRRALLRACGMLAALPVTAMAAAADPVATGNPGACAFAVARLRRGQPVEPSDSERCSTGSGSSAVFQAASLSKPVVAALALKLALRGQLDLDRPLSGLLPGGYVHRQNLFALREPPVVDVVPGEMLEKLTTRHLLSHTSGLPNWASRAPLRLGMKPGTRWRYSGEGYVLLQQILYTLTGLPLNELATAELFEPLRMADTAFKLTERIAPLLVPGRSASGQLRQMRFPYEIAASSLYTSAPDYARFIAATLSDPRLISLMADTPVPLPGAPGVYWGLGWAIEQTPAQRTIWHWGNNPGFRALAMADLTTKDAVVALAATDSGMPRAKSVVRQHMPGPRPGLDLDLVQ